MSFRIEGIEGEAAGASVEVETELLVGRSDDCELSLGDRRLSRHHARFLHVNGRLFVEDLGGPNGTFVNGARVRKRELFPGDMVALGSSRFAVRGPSAPSSGLRTGLVKPAAFDPLPDLDSLVSEAYFPTIRGGEPTLLDARSDRVEFLVRQTKNFAILYEVSRALQREHDREALLEKTLDLVLKVSGADRGAVALLNEAGELEIPVARGSGRTSASGSPLAAVSSTVLGQVLEERSGVLCLDPSEDQRFREAESLFLNETRALMAAPILVGNRVLGLIEVESSSAGRVLGENDLDLLTVVCSTLGVALDNLALEERQRAAIRELEEAHATLLATQDRLLRSEQLAAIGRLAAGIAHEIKNHLSPFMLAEMIAQKHPEEREIQDAAEIMLEAQQHILDLVNEVRSFASGQRGPTTPSEVDLAEIVEGVLRFTACDALVKRTPTRLEIRARPRVTVEKRRLRQVLVNLIRNAADAVRDNGGEIRLRVGLEGGRAMVEVEDTGTGIPEELASRIFEPFFSTKGEAGLGLGLDISRRILREHGGELRLSSELGVGSRFVIELPISPGSEG